MKKLAPRRSTFYEVLAAAIADLAEKGFDSQERLDSWLRKLESTARELLVPPHVLERALRDSLDQIFNRMTKPAMLLKMNKGVSQFTIHSIQPKLHAELNRRILGAANLIKLNREASIQRTLQRFAGWATSVPVGGTDIVNRAEVKDQVRRAIAGLPFIERRVIIDQGHKLTSAINDIVAIDGGAIAAIWRHVNEGGGYQARPDHEKRDKQTYLVRDSWAHQERLVKLDGSQFTDQIERPGEFVFCRCTYQYIYNLRDLPQSMLTAKGLEELQRQRAEVRQLNG